MADKKETTLFEKLETYFNEVAAKRPEYREGLDILLWFSTDPKNPRLAVDLEKASDPEFKQMLQKADKIIREHKGPIR